jgi:hypothetical protein
MIRSAVIRQALLIIFGLEIHTFVRNSFTRCQACLRVEGGYFQHPLGHAVNCIILFYIVIDVDSVSGFHVQLDTLYLHL